MIITNGLMVGLYDNPDDWEIAAQMGVSSYGQMTAGGWMYIGPQGIVHGTYNTLLNAGRRMCGVAEDDDLAGLLFVSSGLGGMSGAQPKAAKIAGAVSITAEVDFSRIKTRHRQGWVDVYPAIWRKCLQLAKGRAGRKNTSIAYHGNMVDLLEYLAIKRFTLISFPTRPPAMWFMMADIVPRESVLMNVRACSRREENFIPC